MVKIINFRKSQKKRECIIKFELSYAFTISVAYLQAQIGTFPKILFIFNLIF